MAGKRKAPPRSASDTKKSKSNRRKAKEPVARVVDSPVEISEEEPVLEIEDEDVEVIEEEEVKVVDRSSRTISGRNSKKPGDGSGEESKFVGNPIDKKKAMEQWPHRYLNKIKGKEGLNIESDGDKLQAKNHFKEALVDGRIKFSLGDDAYVLAGEGEDDYICRIVEMFEGVDGIPYISAQWFYRAKDTVIQSCSNLIDDKRLFLSSIKDDNPLDCLLGKIKIVELPLNASLDNKLAALAKADYYYDMMYHVPFSSFVNSQQDGVGDGNESDSTISCDSNVSQDKEEGKKVKEMRLLDLFSGCGAMSTGLCLGANMLGVKLVTKWAVDINQYACQSLKLNHPETEVRNEKAEDFLALLKEWEKLCTSFSLLTGKDSQEQHSAMIETEADEEDEEDCEDDPEAFEVEQILSVCYGDPNETRKRGLYFKIRWKGYGEDEDTWEPIDGLGHCEAKIKEFVTNGYKSKILPLPGDADVICGGPPCQGISGFNRFRNTANPLEDPKNQQLVVYMDIVDHLKPKYVLMENVVDILRFAKGFLARYALGRLVGMNYQARMGLMAAGSYGLPQFRMRMFMWGAHHKEKLPQYALPTHDVVARGNTPKEFESNAVTYEEGQKVELEKKLFLGDAISDLPPVENDEHRDEMQYGKEPETEFQRFIRLKKDGVRLNNDDYHVVLYDHRPLRLNEDDYQRVCHVPVKKGACFRDFEGVRVGPDNKAELDPDVPRVYLPSGKPLVPDYAISFIQGTSSKPFSRLWWDETVPTVVTRAEPHNQTITHPTQNRVLTIRENARLQGFPDYYQLRGPIKQRYIQVGNAVAIPVARALGYSLAIAAKGSSTEQPLLMLPKKFAMIQDPAE